MSRRNKQQQRAKAAAKKGLTKFLLQDKTGTAAQIASKSWIFDNFRKLYNELCDACKQRVMQTKGALPLNEYCPDCQQKAQRILGSVPTMLKAEK